MDLVREIDKRAPKELNKPWEVTDYAVSCPLPILITCRQTETPAKKEINPLSIQVQANKSRHRKVPSPRKERPRDIFKGLTGDVIYQKQTEPLRYKRTICLPKIIIGLKIHQATSSNHNLFYTRDDTNFWYLLAVVSFSCFVTGSVISVLGIGNEEGNEEKAIISSND